MSTPSLFPLTEATAQGGATPYGMDNQATPAMVDEKTLVGEVDKKYTSWRSLKRPQEIQWFVNNALVRGLQNVRWNDATSQLETRAVPTHKVRPSINQILPKVRQRKAKFLKDRYTPIVTPASEDREDKLNATASQKALEYVSRKSKLEQEYWKTLDWALSTGKGFIWVYWDDTVTGLVQPPSLPDPITGQQGLPMPPIEIPIGDVRFESGSPYEVLVPDLGLPDIGSQHEIMRVKAMPLEELKLRYPGITDDMKGDASGEDVFEYQKQIATLSAKTNVGLVSALADKADKDLNFVIRKELFTRPCAKYPKGRYVVVAGGKVLRQQEMLPYNFGSMTNPFPVVEFPDIQLAGQFWATCIVEQLAGPQKEYNDYRAKLYNHLSKQSHPKVFISTFSKMPQNAWNDEAGEVIRILTPPGVMPPQVITPPPISPDLWQGLMTIRQEIDVISGLPMAMGESGNITSGFQLNLVQESVDSIHTPDIRQHALAFEELYYKARKLMVQGYDIPRLISVVGRAHVPDVVEFSKDDIDENAEIIVYTGSALANSPAVRTQQVIELWNAGILQDPVNPQEGQRKALSLLDAEGIGEFQAEKKRDEEKARLENLNIGKGQPIKPPLPFDDHLLHYQVHTDQMKSSEFDLLWDDMKQKELFAHTLYHMKFISPEQAISTALELGMPEMIPILMPPQLPGQQHNEQQPPAEGGQASASEAPPPQQPPQ